MKRQRQRRGRFAADEASREIEEDFTLGMREIAHHGDGAIEFETNARCVSPGRTRLAPAA